MPKDDLQELMKNLKDPNFLKSELEKKGFTVAPRSAPEPKTRKAPQRPVLEDLSDDPSEMKEQIKKALSDLTIYFEDLAEYKAGLVNDRYEGDIKAQRREAFNNFANQHKAAFEAEGFADLYTRFLMAGNTLEKAYKLAVKQAMEEGILKDDPDKVKKEEKSEGDKKDKKDTPPRRPVIRREDEEIDDEKELKPTSRDTREVARANLDKILSKRGAELESEDEGDELPSDD